MVSCRPLFCETRQFRPRGLVLLFANHYPKADATDGAFWARCRVITFGETCPPERRKPHLDSALLCEREGILSWLVRGALAWREHGLGPMPRGVTEAGRNYRLAEDTVGRFLAECTVWGAREQTPANALYEAFVAWCGGTGERPLSQTKFGRYLGESGFTQTRTMTTRLWQGLRLRE